MKWPSSNSAIDIVLGHLRVMPLNEVGWNRPFEYMPLIRLAVLISTFMLQTSIRLELHALKLEQKIP